MPQVVKSATAESKPVWHQRGSCGQICRCENCAIPRATNNQLVYLIATKRVGPIQLSFITRLVTLCIEERVKRIRIGCLYSMVSAEMTIYMIGGTDVLVYSRGEQPLVSKIAGGRAKLESARSTARQADRAVAASCRQDILCACSSWCVSPNGEHLLIKWKLSWLAGGDIRQGCCLKLSTGNVGWRVRRQQHTQPFVVHKEERLVVPDRASHRGRPLVRIHKRPRHCWNLVVVKPVVGVHGSAIPIV